MRWRARSFRGRAQRFLATAGLVVLAGAGGLALIGNPTATSQVPKAGGCSLFPPFKGGAGKRSGRNLRAFNQKVSRSPIHPKSRRYLSTIKELGGNQLLHPDFGSNPSYGIPFTTVPASQPEVQVSIGPNGFPDESDFGPAPIPPDAPVEAGSDRHVLVVRDGECRLHELYRAEYLGGSGMEWQADSTAEWRLDSAKLRPAGWTSADAAGLPILPGLVRYDEVANGRVKHALRVTFEQTRRAYVKPATHYASSRCARRLPPMGLRLRLKRGYYRRHLADFPAASQARPVFTALYRYGMFVADNGGNWFFTGETDPRWDDDELNRLKDVPGHAFAVVRSGSGERHDC